MTYIPFTARQTTACYNRLICVKSTEGADRMYIKYLEEFLELVSYMNYTTAARKLNLTQSALSKHIAALEREFDATLIDRSKQHIELTQQGRIFCEEASRMLDTYHSAYRRMHDVSSEIRMAGSLRDSAVRYLMSTTQDALRDSDESLRVVTREYPVNALAEALLDKKVDLVIDVMPEHSSRETNLQIEQCYLLSVPLLAVVEKDHPLAERTSVTIDELAGSNIMHPTGSMVVQRGAEAIESIFARHGIGMRKHIFFANSWDDFPTVELAGSVFVMPRSLFSRQLFASTFGSYRGVPISDDDARFPYQLMWRRNENHPAILRYIEALRAAAEKIDAEE